MTPLVKYGSVYLKREDSNTTGSVKDRAVKEQVDHLVSHRYPQAVISSTGNAAISAAHHCYIKNVPLTVFVSPKINPKKLFLLKNITLITSQKPISDAFKYAKTNRYYFLRQSTDPIALVGYQQIALEIISQLPQVTSIFIPIASGTTLLGISQKLPPNVKIFAVQPASYCPIASAFDSNFRPEKVTITDSLSVKMLPLKSRVISAIRQSSGSGLIIQNKDLIKCLRDLKKHSITSSPESALAYAGYLKAKKLFSVGDFPVILFTGVLR